MLPSLPLLHIRGTRSSILDSVFVCRSGIEPEARSWKELLAELEPRLAEEVRLLREGGVKVSLGDVSCLLFGHLTRVLVHKLQGSWPPERSVGGKLALARAGLQEILLGFDIRAMVERVLQ